MHYYNPVPQKPSTIPVTRVLIFVFSSVSLWEAAKVVHSNVSLVSIGTPRYGSGLHRGRPRYWNLQRIGELDTLYLQTTDIQ